MSEFIDMLKVESRLNCNVTIESVAGVFNPPHPLNDSTHLHFPEISIFGDVGLTGVSGVAEIDLEHPVINTKKKK
jgi:hypothetical protein